MKTNATEEFSKALSLKAGPFEVVLKENEADQLSRYYELLLIWNERLHLVAPCSPTEFATTADAVGLSAARDYRLEDLWSGSLSETGGAISAFVPAHGVAMYRVRGLKRRPARGRGLEPHTVLSLAPFRPELELGGSTVVRETFADSGTAPVQRLALSLRTPAGWKARRLGRGRVPRLAAGSRFTVAYRVTAPRSARLRPR